MKVKRFEDLIVWQKSGELVMMILNNFGDCRNYSFRDQMQRAALSVMNNISEGFERENNREFKRFLVISKGSCGEVRSMLYIACKKGYISENLFKELHLFSCAISRMLSGLIRKMRV